MDIAEKTRRINARCGESILTIARKECEALPSLLADDELPERILATMPRDGFKRVVWNVLLVATDRQVLCITTKETVRLAYPDIKSVAMVQGKFIEIVGPNNKWGVVPPTRQEAGRQEADRFVSYVEERLGNSDALPSLTLDQQEEHLASTSKQETSVGPAKPPAWRWAVGISLFLLLVAIIVWPDGRDSSPPTPYSPAVVTPWHDGRDSSPAESYPPAVVTPSICGPGMWRWSKFALDPIWTAIPSQALYNSTPRLHGWSLMVELFRPPGVYEATVSGRYVGEYPTLAAAQCGAAQAALRLSR